MKKLLSFIILFSIIISVLMPLRANAAFDTQLDYRSDTLLLMSVDDGTVVIEKNSGERRYPAALVGVLTAITVLENCQDIEAQVTVKSSVTAQIKGFTSSSMFLKDGEIIKVIDLLYGLMLHSATDAALVLADFIAGNTGDFVIKMNETAAKIGCLDSNFTNPHGLDDDNQYTTAYDLALITRYALQNPQFEKIAKVYSYTVPATNLSKERKLYTTNLMMNIGFEKTYYNSLAKGIRTGTTSKAGRCVITTAAKDGYSYIGVVMNAPQKEADGSVIDLNYAFIDCNKMLKWTFDYIKLRVISDPKQTVREIKVNLSSSADHVRLVPANEITALVPAGIDSGNVQIVPIAQETKTEIDAPVKKGDILGKANILYAGASIAQVNLVAAEDISKSFVKVVEKSLISFLLSPIFLTLTMLFIALFLAYIFRAYLKNKKVKKQRMEAKKQRNYSDDVQQNTKKFSSQSSKKQRSSDNGDDGNNNSILR